MSDEEKKAKIKAYQKQYKQDHKEEHRQYMNEYVARAPQILCACGGRYKQYSGYKHNMTHKHLRFVEEVLNNALESEEPIDITEIKVDELEMKTLADLDNPKLKIKKSDMFIELTGEPEDKPVKTIKRKKPAKSVPMPDPLPKTEIHNVVA
jgi:hypothetical protein